MNIVQKTLFASILTGLTLQPTFASTIDDCKCEGQGRRGPITLKMVGIGLVAEAGARGNITFCTGSTPDSCYAHEKTIEDNVGRADFTTLLTAFTLGKKVVFYCNNKGWAENIHIQQ